MSEEKMPEEVAQATEGTEENSAIGQMAKKNDGQLQKKSVSNMTWRFAERIGAQGIAFVVQLILARLLGPDAYGTIALITVVTAILQVFVDSGLGTALIQKKNADQTDFSTVFYFNMVSCSVLYLALFFGAPLIAGFYENPDLTPLIRVLGITLIISGFRNIQQAYVSKHLLFKKFFFAILVGTLAGAGVGIAMAYLGYGAWALVAQQLVSVGMGTIMLFLFVRWKPSLTFSKKRLGGLFSFGWKMLLSSLIDTVYANVRQLIIGKKYSSEELAYYNKGKQFPYLVATSLNTSIDSVLLPVMSSVQDDRARVKSMTRRSIRVSSYVLWPLMMGLVACAEPFIHLLLGEEWLLCVPFLQVFCISYAFWPIHTANLNAIKAVGRSDLFLILEIVKKAVGVVSIVATIWFGPLAIALGAMICTPISSFINAFPNKKLLGYTYWEQIKDMLPAMILSGMMGGAVYCVIFLGLSSWLTLLIQIPLGVALYVGLSILTKNESYYYVLNFIKRILNRKKGSVGAQAIRQVKEQRAQRIANRLQGTKICADRTRGGKR